METLADRAEIEALMHEWATCIDTRRVERMRDEVFAPEVRVDMGYGVWEGAGEAAASLAEVVSKFEATAHMLSNFRFEIGGEPARCSCYVSGWHWNPGSSPERAADFLTVGVYLDRLRRTEDGWRIVEHRYRRLGPSAAAIGSLPDHISPDRD